MYLATARLTKECRGKRLFCRLGLVSQEDAERRLRLELEHLELAIQRRAHAMPLFSDAAKRYLLDSRYNRTASNTAWHVGMLLKFVGHLEVRKVHDETLKPLVEARLAEGLSATTVNRTLEVARAILHRASRAYRDDEGEPWLRTAPPLITVLREARRPPHPLTWEEQDSLFPLLPDHLARMALFAVNTRLRDSKKSLGRCLG
jgi:hypothetical protein